MSVNRQGLFACALVAFCLGPFVTQNCAAQEMATIEKYMSLNNFEKNPGAMQFVMLRCASLFRLVGGWLQEFPDKKAMGKKYFEVGNSFLDASVDVTQPRTEEFVVGQIKRMTEAYKERWLRQKALSGDITDDPEYVQMCRSAKRWRPNERDHLMRTSSLPSRSPKMIAPSRGINNLRVREIDSAKRLS